MTKSCFHEIFRGDLVPLWKSMIRPLLHHVASMTKSCFHEIFRGALVPLWKSMIRTLLHHVETMTKSESCIGFNGDMYMHENFMGRPNWVKCASLPKSCFHEIFRGALVP